MRTGLGSALPGRGEQGDGAARCRTPKRMSPRHRRGRSLLLPAPAGPRHGAAGDAGAWEASPSGCHVASKRGIRWGCATQSRPLAAGRVRQNSDAKRPVERIIGEGRATWITVSAGPRHAADGGSRATSKRPFSLSRGFFHGPARPRRRRTQELPASWRARLMQVLRELTRGGPGQGPMMHSAQGSPVLESRQGDHRPPKGQGAAGGGGWSMTSRSCAESLFAAAAGRDTCRRRQHDGNESEIQGGGGCWSYKRSREQRLT